MGEQGYGLTMLLSDADLSAPPAEVFGRAGWVLKPEGACRGELCVPLDGAASVGQIADRLGMAIVTNEPSGLRALGPSSVGGRAITSVAAPDVELPLVLQDDVWRLADQRGRRTVMVAWAPW